jgi:hypothetical protein
MMVSRPWTLTRVSFA